VTAHPDVPGNEVWVQRTTILGFHFGDPDYWYAFAGDPSRVIGGRGLAPFTDIAGTKFEADITWLYQQGIMDGCSATRFCPDSFLTRGQLAGALANGLALPPTSTDFYPDDSGHRYEAAINRLAAAGLTRGCGDGNYCPDQVVRRGELATHLVRALGLPPTSVDYFADDEGHRHEDAINRIAAAGIALGCGDGSYCPSYRIRRALASAFLHRAFD
jgi:hypothetical protein